LSGSVVLGWISVVPCNVIGWEERLVKRTIFVLSGTLVPLVHN